MKFRSRGRMRRRSFRPRRSRRRSIRTITVARGGIRM